MINILKKQFIKHTTEERYSFNEMLVTTMVVTTFTNNSFIIAGIIAVVGGGYCMWMAK